MKPIGHPPFGRGLHHFSPTRLFLDRDSRTAVVLNPKVGTTFLRDALARAVVAYRGYSDPSQGRYRIMSMARRFPMASPGVYFEAIRHPDRYAFYAVVRNPYARLKSAWVDKFLDGHNDGYPRSMRRGELAKMRAFARVHGLAGALDGTLVPFSTFLESALTLPVGRMNHHWDAQSAVLMMDRFRYERLFHIETEVTEALAVIGARLGFPEGWAGPAEGRRNASSALAEPVFDQRSADRVFDRFRRDFELLGYDRDSWRGK